MFPVQRDKGPRRANGAGRPARVLQAHSDSLGRDGVTDYYVAQPRLGLEHEHDKRAGPAASH